jgi:hypothetical protein
VAKPGFAELIEVGIPAGPIPSPANPDASHGGGPGLACAAGREWCVSRIADTGVAAGLRESRFPRIGLVLGLWRITAGVRACR